MIRSPGKFDHIADPVCHRCAYDLRGLEPGGKCPECGAPVRVSLRSDRLRYADPVWLKQLHWAVRMPAIGISAATGMMTVFLLLAWLLGGLTLPITAVDLELVTVMVTGLAFALVGAWLVTAPNPMLAARESTVSPRRIARACVPVSLIGMTISVTLMTSGTRWYIAPVFLISPFGLVGTAGAWALSRHIRMLSELLCDDFAAGKAKTYLTNYLFVWPLFAIGLLIEAFLPGTGGCIMAAGLVGILAFGTLLLYSPNYLIQSIESEMAISRELWKDESSYTPEAEPTDSAEY